MRIKNLRQSENVDYRHDVPTDSHGDGEQRNGAGRQILVALSMIGAAGAVAVTVYFLGWSSSTGPDGPGGPGGPGAPGGMPSSSVLASGHGKGSHSAPSLPKLASGGDGILHLLLVGKVLAVSRSSITIDSNGSRPTKVAFTNSTKFTGRIVSISGIKVGDEVYAQVIGQSNADLLVATIRDPVST